MKKFVCPKCGNDKAEEVVTDASVSNEVIGLDDDGFLDYGSCCQVDGGTVSYYQCESCGYVLPKVSSPEDMQEYIQKYGEKE